MDLNDAIFKLRDFLLSVGGPVDGAYHVIDRADRFELAVQRVSEGPGLVAGLELVAFLH